ncbi:hypothetical protein AgCh_002082 [Apium graveolens]
MSVRIMKKVAESFSASKKLAESVSASKKSAEPSKKLVESVSASKKFEESVLAAKKFKESVRAFASKENISEYLKLKRFEISESLKLKKYDIRNTVRREMADMKELFEKDDVFYAFANSAFAVVLKGLIELSYLPSNAQPADWLTKILPSPLFTNLKSKLGMISPITNLPGGGGGIEHSVIGGQKNHDIHSLPARQRTN